MQYNYKIPNNGETNKNTRGQGTALWMAPEVITQNYGFKADVYSFGMVMYELLTCKIPWDGDQRTRWINQLMRIIRQGERPVIDDACLIHAPEGFVELMKQCWRTNPKERPRFDEVLLALHELKVIAVEMTALGSGDNVLASAQSKLASGLIRPGEYDQILQAHKRAEKMEANAYGGVKDVIEAEE